MLYNIEYNGGFYQFDDLRCRIRELKYIEAFQNGYIFMKPLRNYLKGNNSSENAKYDSMEGAINYNGTWKYQSENSEILINRLYTCLNYPVLCCSEVSPEFIKDNDNNLLSVSLDSRMKSSEFIQGDIADYGVIFFSKKEFISRIESKNNEMNLIYTHGPVRYSDSDFSKDLAPEKLIYAAFRKRTSYSYQKEYRFIIHIDLPKSQEFFDFWIPDIKEYSFIVPLNKL
ncbi:MAG: hypothetical protein IJT83_00615 [Victivallales bacterium]|nr:hypothetical protein [Victivallales bacterium]